MTSCDKLVVCAARRQRGQVVFDISTALSFLPGCGCAATATPVRPRPREAQDSPSTRSFHADELEWVAGGRSDDSEEDEGVGGGTGGGVGGRMF